MSKEEPKPVDDGKQLDGTPLKTAARLRDHAEDMIGQVAYIECHGHRLDLINLINCALSKSSAVLRTITHPYGGNVSFWHWRRMPPPLRNGESLAQIEQLIRADRTHQTG